ncbi:MAG: alpha/beta hydrolase fold domain-containing protein, partial [Myxococcales bacterium]|nr:alpha/beta hydrolase fold domain-containing protein [Myxococcales bacterium]
MTRAAMAAARPQAEFRARSVRRIPHRYGARRVEALDHLGAADHAPRRSPIVYVHGGGWTSGLRELYTPELAWFARRGYPVFNIDYPLAPEHPWPEPFVSVLRAIAWVGERFEGADRVHLMGDSAGGNLVMMAGIAIENREILAALAPDLAEAAFPEVRSVVSLYGVLDRHSWIRNGFPNARMFMASYLGPDGFREEALAHVAATPLDHAFDRHPPCLLVAGTKDPLAESTTLCHDTLKARGGRVEQRIYPGEHHAFFNFFWRPAARALRRDVLSFLEG